VREHSQESRAVEKGGGYVYFTLPDCRTVPVIVGRWLIDSGLCSLLAMICLAALKRIGCRMADTLNLRMMRTIAEGEVQSLRDFISLHRRKKTRGEAWFIQQEQILQHRRQVVTLIDTEIASRRERESEAA